MAVSSLLLASALVFAPMNQTTNEISETPVVEETTTTTEDKSFVDELKTFYDNHFNIQAILNGVYGALTSGSLLGLIITIVKNRKATDSTEKKTSETIKKEFETTLKNYIENELKPYVLSQEETQELVKILIKAFVFMQDKSAEGKNALCDLLLKANELGAKDEEVKNTLTVQKAEIEKEQTKVAATNAQVKDDFTPID